MIADDAVRADVTDAFSLGAHRTTLQDAMFAFEQISELAMRALSPGIHDPTTAVHCIDRIGAGLARLVTREVSSNWRADDAGEIRIQLDPVELTAILECTVIAVSRTADVHLQVWVRLVEVLEASAKRAVRSADAETLRACATRLAQHGVSELGCQADQEVLTSASVWATQSD